MKPTYEELESENERLKGEHITCPCQLVEPCHARCSCANSIMSGGCRRCCRYGSDEQQMAAAKAIVAREAALAQKDAALDRLEWLPDLTLYDDPLRCLACGAYKDAGIDKGKHKPDCWWQAARQAGHE